MTVASVSVALSVLFIAALVKSVLGFGEALIGIPLLTLSMGLQIAAPVVSLLAASVAILIILKGWQDLDFKATWRLIVAAAIGVPLGALGLKHLPVELTTHILGIFLIGIGGYYLTQPAIQPLYNERWGYMFGFVAGLFGGAYNITGPPVIIYGAMRRWPPEKFRVTLQGFFLSVNIVILVSHATAGFWTQTVINLYIAALPLSFFAFWIGDRISRRLDPKSFQRLVYYAIIVLGGLLLI